MKLQTKIYQKENNLKISELFKDCFKDFFGSHFLAKQLAIRDIKSQYRQSYLGVIWAFITPITSALVWIVLNLTGTIKLSDTGVPYPIYAFTGTLIWSIIKDSISMPTSSTNAAKSILTKINFPKEALILSGLYKLFFNSSIKVLLLIILLFIFGIGFNWSLFFLPFAIIVAALFGATLGLFITPIGLIYSDVARFTTMILGFVMYITPVVYAVPKEGVMKTIMELNPLTPLILTVRDLSVGAPVEYLNYFLWIFAISSLLFFVGLVFYRVSIPIIVERLSA